MMPPSGNKEVVNEICQINEQMYEMFICSANLKSQNIQAVYKKTRECKTVNSYIRLKLLNADITQYLSLSTKYIR